MNPLTQHPKAQNLNIAPGSLNLAPLDKAFESANIGNPSLELCAFSGAANGNQFGFITHLIIPAGFEHVHFTKKNNGEIDFTSNTARGALGSDVAISLFVPDNHNPKLSALIHTNIHTLGAGGHPACVPASLLKEYPVIFQKAGAEINIIHSPEPSTGEATVIEKLQQEQGLFFLLALLPSLTWCYIAFKSIQNIENFYANEIYPTKLPAWTNLGSPIWHEEWRSFVSFIPKYNS